MLFGVSVKDEQEAAYWDIFDKMTEDWESTMEAKKEWLMPPTSMGASPTGLPDSGRYTSEATSKSDSDEEAPVVKEAIGNNSV